MITLLQGSADQSKLFFNAGQCKNLQVCLQTPKKQERQTNLKPEINAQAHLLHCAVSLWA